MNGIVGFIFGFAFGVFLGIMAILDAGDHWRKNIKSGMVIDHQVVYRCEAYDIKSLVPQRKNDNAN